MAPSPDQHKSLKYRPDIDGLRAVAVLSVLAAHLGTRLAGGYVGVDIFFVISGYLISATILAEMAAGKFSILNFYERRIRRIFPAMLVMMAVVSVMVYFLFIPAEVEDYARSLIAALFSGSNLLFWQQAGYFDTPSQFKPLIHTWSLGVEEQFYIFFPIFLLLLRKWFPNRLKVAIWIFTAVSFAAACGSIKSHPGAAFFLAPLRAWELLIGTIASQHYLPRMRTSLARNAGALVGAVILLYTICFYNSKTPFPGWTALAPCLGAALIISAGEHGTTWVGKVLGLRPVVFVGLISYSLYLWHWPLIVFQRINQIVFATDNMNAKQKVILALISIVLGTLSWRFVEQPFRKGRFRPSRKGVFVINGLALAVMTVLAVTALLTHGLPQRFPPEARAIAAYTGEKTVVQNGVCFIDAQNGMSSFKPDPCLTTHPGKKSILVIGDSHAAHLLPGLIAAYPERDVLQATSAGCAPFLPKDNPTMAFCGKFFHFLYENYLPDHKFDLVVLSARWTDQDTAAIGNVIAYLKSLHLPVVLVGPSPEFADAEPRLVAMALRRGKTATLERNFLPGPARLDRQMAQLAQNDWHVPYISVFNDLCPQQQCPLYAQPNVPLLNDADHLTFEASNLLGRAIHDQHQLP